MTTVLFDYDPILYAAGSVGETRTVKIVHRQSGDEYEFDNRTVFWGHWKAKAGGWLADYNKGADSPRLPEEFDVTDVQTPEPIENCLHTVKRMIEATCETIGTKSYYGYSGKGKTFREDISTILKYKGNRDNSLRPFHLDNLKEYLTKHHNCEIITRIEADDACTIDSYNGWHAWKKSRSDKDKLVLAFQDKDYYGIAGHIFNTNTQEPICSYDGFGWLGLNDKGDVKGRGRLWLLHQVMSSDDADNYAANSACDMRWGEKSSFKLLKDCTTDKEAFEAVVAGYKKLYPAKKKIVGWRGDEIEIDWLYVLQENFNLAKMLRSAEEQPTDIKEVLDKLGIAYVS
jgi:hypothetical protein